MHQPSLFQDLRDLIEILFRLGLHIAGFAICCGFLYQSYQAGRSALIGINTDGSAPVSDPKSLSSRFGAAMWCLMALALSTLGFAGIFGFNVWSIILKPWAP
jgi:hypothetical protein